ncbi:response regulator transcription factor [Amycolatopsis sp. CA-230715]|uniref:response regulator transcription factor n=1 Tax=Amycolatopsis sp. CA-230715 TaxID=2745196 RepID=UPI001C021B7A|nr:response regulator transcription factor [Amycolatopsis sp. CA-230715]QWF82073.1 Transcriptional activator protein CopR [Amycolatopsis sp. CA-230715]
MRVLVIEDNEDLRLAIGGTLRGAGFAVDAVGDLPQADEALTVNSYDCAVFDRLLPSGDALTYVRRNRPTVPVLFLTALDSVNDRIAGLELGDDYLVKPFAMDELTARVRSLCRRVTASLPPVLRCGDLVIDVGRREVRRAAALLTLTRKEFDVLELLVLRQGETVSRAALAEYAWDEFVAPSSNVVAGVIKQLRKKLREPDMITNVRGDGYFIHPA